MAYIFIHEIPLKFLNDESFSPSIQDYIQSHQNEKARELSCYAFSWLRKYVKRYFQYDINLLTLKVNAHHKPYFDEFGFNFSHSGSYLIVGISKGIIGVDIQQIKEVPRKEKIAKKIFDEETFKDFQNTNCDKKFIEEFAKKEAYLKYLGTGFGDYNQKDKPLYCQLISLDLKLKNEYVLACCCLDSNIQVYYEDGFKDNHTSWQSKE